MIRVAILVDGSFFLKRFRSICKVDKDFEHYNPEYISKKFQEFTLSHLNDEKHSPSPDYLYRIFYYDYPPLNVASHYPVSKNFIDFSKTEEHEFRLKFFERLKKMRKVALRLGELIPQKRWILKHEKYMELEKGAIEFKDLKDDDYYYLFHQKGVDMKLGTDIASMSYKKQVDKIVLIAGGRDFVPAAKTARREGIDFVLDLMWQNIGDFLSELIDGLFTPKSFSRKKHDS